MDRAEAIKYIKSVLPYTKPGKEYESLFMAITALREQEQSKWISVKERLPEPFVSVLVYMPGERPFPTVHEGYVTKDGCWYAHFFSREQSEVTCWKPLPDPPKEGADHA